MTYASKRDFFKFSAGAVAGVALAGCGGSDAAAPTTPPAAPAFVLVHGAWECAWIYERLLPLLAAQGHAAVARDLPGHGLNARAPASAQHRPLDRAAFATEPSPVAAVTLEDLVTSIVAIIDQLRAAGHGPVVLVGHSLSGVAITAVAERVPEKLAKLVYVAGFMPASGVPGVSYMTSPENQGEQIAQLLLADPATVGALRVDYRSENAAYRATSQLARYGDLAVADYDAVANLLSCDEPVGPISTPITTTAARWGRVPRHYITCLQDRAVMPALQQRFIREADAFVPGNPTQVHPLDSAHTPQLSQPQALADLLTRIARS